MSLNIPAADLPALIEQRLQQLQPSHLHLIDESHLHIGHAGAKNGGRHFRVQIRSKHFDGLNTLARHRLVYAKVADLMPHPIHALAIEASSST